MEQQQIILIVDDEPMIRSALEKMIRRWTNGSYDILVAEHGLQALEILQTRSVELLLTDINMPGMTGLELLQEVNRQKIEITIILLTGYAEFEYARQALVHGATDYLLKPIDPDKLITAVEKGLATHKKNRQMKKGLRLLLADPEAGEVASQKIDHPLIREALDYIHSHFTDVIGLKDVAEYIHVSPTYLSELFKEVTRETFIQYVTRIRISRAKQLLLQTDMKVYEISEAVGYKTARYFVKVFHEIEGKTPHQYRGK